MTEKRYSYDPKQVAILKDGEFWLEGQIDTACNHSEICNELNQLNEENDRLKKERNHFERKKTQYLTEWNTCRIQNTELKKDNHELKEAMKRMMIEMMGGKMND